MSGLRHAGLHWPENAGGEHPNRQAIADMPGMAGAALICSPSARYHYDYLRKRNPDAVVVWRAVPRQGSLPAQLGWEPNKVADECLNLWDEQPHGGTEWFLPLNELQFEKENGAPFPGYGRMAEHLGQLRLQLRRKLTQRYGGLDARLMFPAWVPQDDGDRLDEWITEARQWDAVCLHAYGDAEAMRARYGAYRDAFGPNMPIFVGEWNANHTGADERASLEMWAEVAANDPAFLGAAYYIWETRNAGEHDLSIWGNGERYGLFLDPPVAHQETAPMPDYRAMTRSAALAAGINPGLFERQIDQESGFAADVIECRRDSSAGAEGIAQIVRRWHPDVDPCDPPAALAYAASLMAGYLRQYDGNWPLALSCYNAGPGATASGLAGTLDGWPYPETVGYVSAILDIPQAEARRSLTSGQLPDPEVLYGPDVPDEVVRQRNDWSCAVRAAYAATWSMARMGHGPDVTYGDEGPSDIYEWLVPTYDDSDSGLKDRSGRGLVEALRAHGYAAGNQYASPSATINRAVTIDDVRERAGRQPILLGGAGWGPAGHWVYVRGRQSDGMLILENPAGTYVGIADLLRDSFDRLGPWAMVWIDIPHKEEDVARIAELEARVAELEAEIAELTRSRNSLIEGLAVAADDHGDTIQSALDAIRQIRTERVGVRP